ncbi:ABC-2 type transport system ATP-binding protein [Mesorhizobium sp. J18]|uniref:ABC transporter ATP-binding protein n=1 Tax=Mesorhizobium sp. J18 TaxID=935263 RepID=UPI00119B6851|nr:ABC transporter ATP-binding protein [Mesorhizobium sp. J18]TWG94969.1 ABC-2 type transport system ATP-binding protein [Mesorhizobium sp. J18]
MRHVQAGKGTTAVAALEVDAVSHSYGQKQALKDVTFSIPPGRFTVLLGLNGAGKTTLFSLISRLYATQRGSIRIFGHDIGRNSREALRRLGIVFQARTLDLDLSVRQNLSYHASLHGIGTAAARRRIESVLDTVEMGSRLRDKVRSLSGGQMRRVEIARALLHQPQLMLLDEATVGLDIQSRASILAFIRRLVAAEGISVLWATHLIDEVEADDTVVMLREGQVTADGRVPEILQATGTSDIKGAFSKLCRPAGETQEVAA